MIAWCRVIVPEIKAELELSEDGTTILGCKNYDAATYIDIPSTVTTIGKHAFYKDNLTECEYVKTLKVPSSVTRIEEFSFSRTFESVYIPPSVVYIGSQNISLYNCVVYVEAGSYAEQWAKNRADGSQRIEIITFD